MTKLLFCVASLIIASCATHRQVVTQTTSDYNSVETLLWTKFSSLFIDENEKIDIIFPRNLALTSPISGIPSKETPESDTIHIHRRSTKIACNSDTTAAKAISTAKLTTQSETKSTTNRQPATPSGSIAGRVYIIIALLILCTIIVWFLRRNLHV